MQISSKTFVSCSLRFVLIKNSVYKNQLQTFHKIINLVLNNSSTINHFILKVLFHFYYNLIRGGSRAAATSKMERLVIIVNGWKPLTIIDVAAALDPPPFNKVWGFITAKLLKGDPSQCVFLWTMLIFYRCSFLKN